MNYKSVLVFCLLALASCINFMGGKEDEKRISGLYILESVDGSLVPAPVAPQQGCNRTVRAGGILTLSAGGPDTRPMYDWSLAIDADCQPVPRGVFQGDDDVGSWRFHSTQLSFVSMKRHGAYSATLEETPGRPPAVTVVHLGNAYRFTRLMRWDDPQGVVYVKFVDQSGQPVERVILTFTFSNGLVGGGQTPETGEYGTGGVVGECKISFTVPTGYEMPASQLNPFSVTIVEGPALRVQVSLTKL